MHRAITIGVRALFAHQEKYLQSVAEIEATPEVQDLRNRVSGFLNEQIYPNEKILERGGDEASRTFKAIQAEAKKRGLWALGLPKEIGGGGLEFMPYVFVNEIGMYRHARFPRIYDGPEEDGSLAANRERVQEGAEVGLRARGHARKGKINHLRGGRQG